MHSKILTAVLVAMTGFTSTAVAVGPDGQATQINIYSDQCANFVDSRLVYYVKTPRLGECFDLNLPSNARSVNVASAFVQLGNSVKATSASCDFYDGFGCKGVKDTSFYLGSTSSSNCVRYRSNQGFFWKSARCFVNQ